MNTFSKVFTESLNSNVLRASIFPFPIFFSVPGPWSPGCIQCFLLCSARNPVLLLSGGQKDTSAVFHPKILSLLRLCQTLAWTLNMCQQILFVNKFNNYTKTEEKKTFHLHVSEVAGLM